MAELLHFEDFPTGRVFELGSWRITADEIVDFGRRWDPLPFHTDPAAPADGPYGGLIASGRHSGVIWMRLWVDAVLSRAVGMGSPGIDEIRWHRPVRPGDVLTCTTTVLEARPSSSRADRGTVVVEGAVVNQDGEVATTIRAAGFFRRRGAPSAEPPQPVPPATAGRAAGPVGGTGILDAPGSAGSIALPPDAGAAADDLLHWDDFPAGHVTDLGSWAPTEEELIAFARRWDPQPFHVDPAAAATGPFGGIVASGWHGLCVWGRLYVDVVHLQAASMGGGAMEDISFRRPIRPGAALRARIAVLEATASRTRPERGTTVWRGTFVDDAGDEVLVMHGRAFFRRRGV